ncbi:MAG: hypothetical protein A2Z34_08850 [Planctomycetes bacterium RBG_16_59_8]|nr:MAG: hypothetical protein A2Z34_08850 [Planctomycetes bacterium RBG_16_59_8]
MPRYTFEAVDKTGRKLRGEVEATAAQEAIGKIKAKGLNPLAVKEKEAPPAPKPAAPSQPPPQKGGGPSYTPSPAPKKGGLRSKPSFLSISLFGGSVSQKQLTQFTQQLSVLQNAGLPITRSLKILANQQKPGALKSIATNVAEDVETGSSLSDALARHPKAFNKLYINMVRAGEAGGILDIILQRLASFMEKSQALKRKVIGASIYPVVVLLIAFLVVFGIMWFIIPKFVGIFHKMKVDLPVMTSFLMDTSAFVSRFWFIIVLVPIAIFIVLRVYSKTKAGRIAFDRLKINMPLFGTIVRKAVIARFTRTLGTLLQSGVNILEALNIVKGAVGNEVVTKAIEHVHDSVREGESIAAPLAQSKVFDDMVINMIEVGEETGELDKMLLKVADTYEAEVDASVSNLMNILEPLLILTLGVIVGFIVVALFLPLVSILKNVGGK